MDCGAYDLDLALEDPFYASSFELEDPAFGNSITAKFNGKIKENFNCLISRSPENQLVSELIAYIDIYTQLLSENFEAPAWIKVSLYRNVILLSISKKIKFHVLLPKLDFQIEFYM